MASGRKHQARAVATAVAAPAPVVHLPVRLPAIIAVALAVVLGGHGAVSAAPAAPDGPKDQLASDKKSSPAVPAKPVAEKPTPGAAAKAENKSEPKSEAKSEAKAAAKPDSAAAEGNKREANKAEADKPAASKNDTAKVAAASNGKADAPGADAQAVVDPKPRPRAKSRAGAKHKVESEPPAIVGEGPSPASPPPLTIAGLREETRRESGPVALDPAAPARTKLEQMLDEVTKARAALHEDTSRLEAMLTQDAGDGTSASAGAGGGAPGAAKPAKNPLDILAKALRGIKPEQAAPIVTRLDKRLAATVLQKMPPIDAGKIMGAMKPDTAAELATQIAMRPLPREVKR